MEAAAECIQLRQQLERQRQQLEQQRQQLEQQRIQMRQQELQIGEMRITNAWAQFHVHTGQTEIALDHLLGHYPDN